MLLALQQPVVDCLLQLEWGSCPISKDFGMS